MGFRTGLNGVHTHTPLRATTPNHAGDLKRGGEEGNCNYQRTWVPLGTHSWDLMMTCRWLWARNAAVTSGPNMTPTLRGLTCTPGTSEGSLHI
jgi:hypothetical protein